LLALAASAARSAGLLSTVVIAAALLQATVWASRPSATLVFAETANANPGDLRVGEHRFRIPRAYFRHPPHPSGVDTGFYVRALWPGMEPETDANRSTFRASVLTPDGQRVLQIVLVPTKPGVPQTEVARWMLGNAARRPNRFGAGRGGVEDFAAPSGESFGLHLLRGLPWPGTDHIDEDLYHGALPDGRFVGGWCGRDPRPERPTSCLFWFDWRAGAYLQVRFVRARLPEWREIAEATLALVDRWAVKSERPATLDVEALSKTTAPQKRP
jgi:hypothetical protein